MKTHAMNSKYLTPKHKQNGLSLIELLVAMALTLVLVGGAMYIYLGTRETQKAQERITESAETGALALAMLGRELANAGYYPSTMPPTSKTVTKKLMDTYPPNNWKFLATAPAVPTAYLSGVFGCDGAKFNPDNAVSTCPATAAGSADSIVINYFTTDAMGSAVGHRRDCTGADVGNDPVNATRKLNAITNVVDVNLPPKEPLFVSNRYALNDTNLDANKVEVDKQIIRVKSLACNGNGSTAPTIFQPMLAGIEDMQFTYGVYKDETTLAPEKFYTATEIAALADVAINGVVKKPWSRVVAVRVCLMSRTIGGSPKITDKAGALRTYLVCNTEVPQTQLATDNNIYKRYVQTFGLRNQLTQAY
jgi:type IV pilus assembly protein PilW